MSLERWFMEIMDWKEAIHIGKAKNQRWKMMDIIGKTNIWAWLECRMLAWEGQEKREARCEFYLLLFPSTQRSGLQKVVKCHDLLKVLLYPWQPEDLPSSFYLYVCMYAFIYLFIYFPFRTTAVAYGSSQAREQISAAAKDCTAATATPDPSQTASVTYATACGKARSLILWVRPEWTLVLMDTKSGS